MNTFVGRLGDTQTAAFTDTAGTIANGVGSQIYKVRVAVTADAFIAIGATATTTDAFMAANHPEYFTITPGQKVSAVEVTASTGGNLYVTEMV